MIWVLLLLASTLCSWVLTDRVRRYALARSILDVPNHRSSHILPTPRGGGLAIAIVVLGGILLLALANVLEARVALAVAGGGLVALVGWQDDRKGLPIRVRASAQLLAAVWAVYWIGGIESFRVGQHSIHLGVAGHFVAVMALVWATNLYNFMDGIDGLAGGQGISIGMASAVLLGLEGRSDLMSVAILLTGASAGFLLWNWPPAKVFMGDVGSSLLGYLVAVLALVSEREGALPALVYVLLSGVFVSDATITLLRRWWRGERWYDAHRQHAYQRATQAGWTHRRVTSGVLLINVSLAALAFVATTHPPALPACIAAGIVILLSVYLWAERIRPM